MYQVAVLAVETGIAPQHLIDAPPGMMEAMWDWLQRQAVERKKAANRHGS